MKSDHYVIIKSYIIRPGEEKRIMKRLLTLILFIFLFLNSSVYGDEHFRELTKKTLSYFQPLKGKVLDVKGDVVEIDIGRDKGVKKGLRLKVFKEGVPFYHPVTGEFIGRIEQYRGVVEATTVNDTTSLCKVLQGNIEKGDTVKVSSLTKTRLLFHQSKNVDYYLGDAYYKDLKKTGKFDLVDAPIENLSVKELVELAREKEAEAIISLDSRESDDRIVLTQRLIWSDGTIFGTDSVEIDPSYVRSLREGAEFLLAGTNEPLLNYNLPFDAELIAVGDVDGNKEMDLLISDGVDVYVYKYDVDLSFLYLLKGNATERIVYLDLIDIDKDGRDEVVVSSISDETDETDSDDSTLSGEGEDREVVSYVYRVEDKGFKELWSTRGFLRKYRGGLLYQAFSPVEGFQGPVRKVSYNEGFHLDGDLKGLPGGANIYNFVSLKDGSGEQMYILIDKDNFINLKDKDGLTLWRSPEDLGGFIREFTLKRFSPVVEPKKIRIYDRLSRKGKEIFIVKREPLVKKAETAGYKSSSVRVLWPSGYSLEQSVIIDKIPGELKDYYIFGDKIAVISKPLFGIKAGNILKGENPFVDYLFIYSLRGR